MIDKCEVESGYSWKLCEELSVLIGENRKLTYYAPKKCPVPRQPGRTELKRTWSPFIYPFQLLKELIKDRPEIAHIQFEFSTFGSLYSSFMVLLLLIIVKALGIKSVVTLHGPIFKLDSSKEALGYLLPRKSVLPASLVIAYMIHIYRMISKISTKVVTHNSSFKQIIVEEYGINENKVAVIPHGISLMDNKCLDLKTHSYSIPDTKIILYFGYISPRKGLEDLIMAFKQVQKIYPNYALVIAGTEAQYYKGYTDFLKSLVEKNDQIIFTGFVDDNELYALISKAKLVVLPYAISISASGPLALAIQFRKPIVATKTEFFDEVLSDGYDALLAQPGNSSDLANKIIQIINDRNLHLRLSQNIKFKADQYSWKKIAKLTMDLYADVANYRGSVKVSQVSSINGKFLIFFVHMLCRSVEKINYACMKRRQEEHYIYMELRAASEAYYNTLSRASVYGMVQ